MEGIGFADTATKLTHLAGQVVICGSHGGAYVGLLAAAAGVRAILLNDAGRGREDAAMKGLAILEAHGVAAATIAHDSARIGNAQDHWCRGIISAANSGAQACGVTLGATTRDAAGRLAAAPSPASRPTANHEHRSERMVGPYRLIILDSNGLVRPEADDGAIIVTGSHGGLVGDDPASAGRANARLFAFNDAGVGIEQAGLSRLPALDARAIPAVCVDAFSARIGEGRSTYDDGVISHANNAAISSGARAGVPLKTLIAELAGP